MLPIYWLDYKVGTWFVPGDVTHEQFAKILEYEGFAGWWDTILGLFVQIGTPLILGSLVVATLCSVLSYPTMRWLLSWLPPRKHSGTGGLETVGIEVAGSKIRSSPVHSSPEIKS
jgi:uncharacterized protein